MLLPICCRSGPACNHHKHCNRLQANAKTVHELRIGVTLEHNALPTKACLPPRVLNTPMLHQHATGNVNPRLCVFCHKCLSTTGAAKCTCGQQFVAARSARHPPVHCLSEPHTQCEQWMPKQASISFLPHIQRIGLPNAGSCCHSLD